jgi:hypothetical protein
MTAFGNLPALSAARMQARRHLPVWVFAAAAAALLPMLWPAVPGMADLPNHLARHHVLAGAGQGGALARWFRVDWRWIGNLGVDLPVLVLTPWLGVEAATRAVAALIAPLTVLGLAALARAAHGRMTAGAALALPLAMAQPWMYGFVNYTLAIALGLLAGALWIGWRRGPRWRAAMFAPVALAVWTAHVMGWAVLLLLVAGHELARVRDVRGLVRRALCAAPLLVPLAPMLAWSAGAAGWSYDRHLLVAKAMNFVTVLKGSERGVDLALTAAMLGGGALALWWSRRVDSGLAIAAALLALATLALPTTVLGSWGADLRLAPVAVAVALVAVSPAAPARERLLLAVGLALFAVRVAEVTADWTARGRALDARLALLERVPRGSRMGFVAVETACGTPWRLTPDRKLGAYAVVRRDAFANTLFQIPGSDLMTLREPADRGRWYDGSQDVAARCPGGADRAALEQRLAAMRRAGFATVWVSALPSRQPLAGWRRVARVGDDVLLGR